jgi:hypothetical protein
VATSNARGNILRYQSISPRPDFVGEIEALPMWSGQSAALVRQVQSAGDIVREIYEDARKAIEQLAL